MGIKFRETKFLVYVNTLASVEYVVGNKGKMISTNIWSNSEISYPLQVSYIVLLFGKKEAFINKCHKYYLFRYICIEYIALSSRSKRRTLKL